MEVTELKFKVSTDLEHPLGISHSAELKASCPQRNQGATANSNHEDVYTYHRSIW